MVGESPETMRRQAPVLVPSSTQIAPPGWMPIAAWAVVTDVALTTVTWPKKAPPPPSHLRSRCCYPTLQSRERQQIHSRHHLSVVPPDLRLTVVVVVNILHGRIAAVVSVLWIIRPHPANNDIAAILRRMQPRW